MKSIVIIGKGPSVSKSTKSFVDSFDEVAICNFPPMEKHQHLISNRAKYHFFNAGDTLPYHREFMNNLGLTHAFNTSICPTTVSLDRSHFLPDHPVIYDAKYGLTTTGMVQRDGKCVVAANGRWDFWPSTGLMTFDYFYNSEEYNKIALVGIDCYQKGSDVYYFGLDETNPSLHYLWNGSRYSKEGKVINHQHAGEREYIAKMIEKSDKEIMWRKNNV